MTKKVRRKVSLLGEERDMIKIVGIWERVGLWGL
jgi:hypothetical protein